MQKTGDKIFQSGTVLFGPAQEKVIRQHGGYAEDHAYFHGHAENALENISTKEINHNPS
ncbi:MAG: hypothetical protein WC762_04110 [Methylobacter sp.]|jgi:hypothetical protein